MTDLIKLNLGCGQNLLPGFINVDKYGNPDVQFDLETFPWPWEDNSVTLVEINHVLEHLGESSETYLMIFQELYRVCAADAIINIAVPHPRHDSFLNDPTHVRPVTLDGLVLFSKSKNREWAQNKIANSPLGLYLDVDFEITESNYLLDDIWTAKLAAGQLKQAEIMVSARKYNNVIKEIRVKLKVIK